MPARLSKEQLDARMVEIVELINGHPARGDADDPKEGPYTPAYRGLRKIVPELLERLEHGASVEVDGFPASSLGGSSPAATDEDGELLPPHADPTGSAVVTRVDHRSAVRDVLYELVSSIDQAINSAAVDLEEAVSQAEKARAPKGTRAPSQVWCTNCLLHDVHTPRGEKGRGKDELCRDCDSFDRAEGFPRPRAIVEAKARGEKVTKTMVNRERRQRGLPLK